MPRIARAEFPDFSRLSLDVERLMPALVRGSGNLALNFFQDSFRRQGFLDRRLDRWPDRRAKDKNPRSRGDRTILVESGRLRASLRMRALGQSSVEIFTDVPYARAHNFGERVKATQRVRAHVRQTRSGQKTTVRAHDRTVDFQMPQRQFIGDSHVLEQRLELHLTRAFDQLFEKIARR